MGKNVQGDQGPGCFQPTRPESTPDEKADRTDRATAEKREGAADMNHLRGFKQKLSTISRLWQDKEYDTALAEVESLQKSWPGNAHLHILWASLVQLQEEPKHELWLKRNRLCNKRSI
jgi:hypothetical protein